MTQCHYNQHTSHTNICVIYQLTTHVLSQHTFQMTWHVACPILGQSNNILPRVGSTRYFLQCTGYNNYDHNNNNYYTVYIK